MYFLGRMDEEDRKRYFVVASVILEIVTPLFRKQLEDRYRTSHFTCLQDFLNHQQVIHTLFHFRHRNMTCCKDQRNCKYHNIPLYQTQWNLLYTKVGQNPQHFCHCIFTANPVPTADLDMTLASFILLNCCNLAQPIENAIRSLRQYRNDYFSHNTDIGITEREYNILWQGMTTYILQMDVSKKDDLIRIENRPLDVALCTKYCTIILDIRNSAEEVVICLYYIWCGFRTISLAKSVT
jgi:hypothetical protein